MIEQSGNIRIDLLGGTLDLNPINVILDNVVTINLATTLQSTIRLEKIKGDIIIESEDYQKKSVFKSSDFSQENLSCDFFGPFKFIACILDYFRIHEGVHVFLKSDSPPGAGLGGSSTMGMVLYRALCTLTEKKFHLKEAVDTLMSIESCILDAGPVGYQDYYPSICGGIPALSPKFGQIELIQLYSDEFKRVLENGLTLVYSGQSRLSGRVNWEVYKGFFDNKDDIRKKLQGIADLSHMALLAVRDGRFEDFLALVREEGQIRKTLSEDIVSRPVGQLYESLKKDYPGLGLKICGAGGGGCFLLVHDEHEREDIRGKIAGFSMKCLDFAVAPPKIALSPEQQTYIV